jgi:hypothetical protein
MPLHAARPPQVVSNAPVDIPEPPGPNARPRNARGGGASPGRTSSRGRSARWEENGRKPVNARRPEENGAGLRVHAAELVPLTELRPHPANYRTHLEDQ